MDLAIATKQQQLDTVLPKHLHQWQKIFSEQEASRLPQPRPYDLTIKLKPDFVPHLAPIYQLPLDEEKELRSFLDDNLKKGYIVPSTSPQASGFFFIKKKDGKLRPVQD